jgi:hypothetical protein
MRYGSYYKIFKRNNGWVLRPEQWSWEKIKDIKTLIKILNMINHEKALEPL